MEESASPPPKPPKPPIKPPKPLSYQTTPSSTSISNVSFPPSLPSPPPPPPSKSTPSPLLSSSPQSPDINTKSISSPKEFFTIKNPNKSKRKSLQSTISQITGKL